MEKGGGEKDVSVKEIELNKKAVTGKYIQKPVSKKEEAKDSLDCLSELMEVISGGTEEFGAEKEAVNKKEIQVKGIEYEMKAQLEKMLMIAR